MVELWFHLNWNESGPVHLKVLLFLEPEPELDINYTNKLPAETFLLSFPVYIRHSVHKNLFPMNSFDSHEALSSCQHTKHRKPKHKWIYCI